MLYYVEVFGEFKRKMYLKFNENVLMLVFFDMEFFCFVGVCVRKFRVIVLLWSIVFTVSCTKF